MARSAPKSRQTRERTWEPTDWQCIGMLAFLVGLFFAPFLSGRAFLWEDFVYQWYPFRQFAASTLASGALPLWNPYTFNGMPFLAEIQTEVFYLPMTVLTLFVRDGHLDVFWLELVNLLHYWLAGTGMFLLARSYGLRRVPSLFAGIVYAFSGFMVLHAIHQVILVVVAWFPLILWLVRKAFASPQWWRVFLAGAVLGHSFFGGSPQMSLFFYFFLLCFVVFELLSTYGFRGLAGRPAILLAAKAAAIVAVSIGIAMVQFLPTQELSALSVRAQITFAKATEGSLGWGQILTLLVPKLFGVSDAHGSQYWGPGPYWHYWETCVYVGILPLLLMIAALWILRSNRTVLFLGGVAIFALLFSLGGNFILHPAFFHYVPGFAAFRNPARMGIFLAFAAALLSAFLLHHLAEEQPQRLTAFHRRTLLSVAGGILALLIVLLTGALDGVLGIPHEAAEHAYVNRQLLAGTAIAAVSAWIVWLSVNRTRAGLWIGLLACATVFADAYLFSADHNTSPDDPAEHFQRAQPLIKYIRAQEGLFRVNTRNPQGLIMDRNQGLVDRIFTMEGYTPLVLQRLYPSTSTPAKMFDLLNIRFITVTDSLNRRLELHERREYLSRAHMVYNVHPVHSEDELLTLMKSPEFDPAVTALVEADLPAQVHPPADSLPAWNAEVTGYQPNRIDMQVATPREGFLVLSEMFYPGWNAYVDGAPTPVYRTDYSLRGIAMPAGAHTVTFRFESGTFQQGLWITLATLALCLAGGVISWKRQRTRTAQAAGR